MPSIQITDHTTWVILGLMHFQYNEDAPLDKGHPLLRVRLLRMSFLHTHRSLGDAVQHRDIQLCSETLKDNCTYNNTFGKR